MMNTNSKLTLLFILLLNFGYGQEIVLEENKNRILPPSGVLDNGTTAYTEHEDSFILSFIEGDNLSICLFDNSFNQKDKALLFKTETGYPIFLNSYGTSKREILIFEKSGFFTGISKKKLLAVSYDFDSKNTIQKLIEVSLDNQKFLETFTKSDKFYVLTLLDNFSVFRLHVFDSNLNYESKDIDISKGLLYYDNKLKEFPSQYAEYTTKYIFNPETLIFSTISENEPNDLSPITQEYKLYVYDNKLILTLDINKDLNTLIEIDLENFSSVTKQTQRQFFTPQENKYARSNSFLLSNSKLFLLKGNSKKVAVSVLDLKSNSFVFEKIFDDNTPFLTDRNLVITKEILEANDIPKSKKEKDGSLKKQMKKIIWPGYYYGIRAVEVGNNIFVTSGSYKRAALYQMGTGIGGDTGSFTVLGDAYSFSKKESIDFYLSKNNFSIKLDNDKDPYLRMDDFIEELKNKKIIWITKFKKGNDYILGYYDKDEEKYYLRKFN